jgi:hypothetical protein
LDDSDEYELHETFEKSFLDLSNTLELCPLILPLLSFGVKVLGLHIKGVENLI